MNISSFITKDYENKSNLILGENKPNQTQFQTNCNMSLAGMEKGRKLMLPAISPKGINFWKKIAKQAGNSKV
ncbi:MAG: hypothetical protein ACYS6W_10810 [Planctomycetota bacterium]